MKTQFYSAKSAKGWLLLLMPLLLVGCMAKPIQQPNNVISPSPAATQTPVPPAREPEPPETVNETVGQASTKIFDNIAERNNNLKIAIHAIDGKVINPGEEFSFNQTVGPRTVEKGYQEAIGYDENGEKVPTVGGGVCQISSTLYMAALNGNFPVTERHSHSHEVPYADSNHDATVSYGGYDFRFQNNRDKPIVIRIATVDLSVCAEFILINQIKSL